MVVMLSILSLLAVAVVLKTQAFPHPEAAAEALEVY
jgi:hypothetical protein